MRIEEFHFEIVEHVPEADSDGHVSIEYDFFDREKLADAQVLGAIIDVLTTKKNKMLAIGDD